MRMVHLELRTHTHLSLRLQRSGVFTYRELLVAIVSYSLKEAPVACPVVSDTSN